MQVTLNQLHILVDFSKFILTNCCFVLDLVTPNIQSQLIDEPLSTGTISNNEQNQSILSFPEHDTPLSQKSERLVDDDTQLKLNAQILVNDSIENAQKKYQKDLQNNTL